MEHFENFLQEATTTPDKPLSDLRILSQLERQQLLFEWNQTLRHFDKEILLPQLFERQVERTPEAIAADFGGQTITYRTLNERANQMAHYLKEMKVGSESVVAISMDRSLNILVAILGIMKAGAAYLPLDSTYPRERLSFMLQDSNVQVLLTQDRLSAQLPEWNGKKICLDTEWESIQLRNKSNTPKNTIRESNLAYVIYTSGSTGKPKGVMISHKSLINYLLWAKSHYSLQDGNGSIFHSPIGFDLTVTSVFLPLLAGKRILLLKDNDSIEGLRTELRKERDLSFIKVTPSHLDALGQLMQREPLEGKIRAFIVGGEALNGESLTFWQRNSPDTRFFNEYGPTEATVGCCVFEVPAGTHLTGSVLIGRPIVNTQLYILDASMEPVPIGVQGEIYVGGDTLARGYLNRPELTAQSFLPNPFGPEPGGRLYRTGDLARYQSDGNIEFLGRFDDQVKIRGFRIELGEVESALLQYPGISEATVTAREDSPGDKRLVAYLVLTNGADSSDAELVRFLNTKLPEYMIPSAFIRLQAFPLTPNGKVDRAKLPLPGPVRTGIEGGYVAPRNELEEELARIWQDVLRADRIGIDDNFFDVGGHSMLAVRLFVRIEQLTGKNLPLATLFQAPTILQLG